jgi:asparagine synthase (glutamine-hydrolysing)
MCGICGKLSFDPGSTIERTLLQRMTDAMFHRGPDDAGLYLGGPIGLGHRRLSIIDLNTGHQPISNEDGTAWIVFNGEIYNYRELRRDLLRAGHNFKTATDTEVILHVYEERPDDFVSSLRGMFAFAIWDSRRQRLILARDRVGIKPLYYCSQPDSLIFGSEIKALLEDSSVDRSIDPQAIEKFLAFRYVPGETTLFSSIKKLEPGHALTVERGQVSIRRYWDLDFSKKRSFQSFPAAVEELDELLQETVRMHMISDVPVGVLLSGGVDSSGVLALASEHSDVPIQTFSVGFSGENFADERVYAAMAAQRYGSTHFDISLTEDDFRDFLPNYVWHMEEPVCEPPAVALYYVSKLAGNHVKVVLSGEGADEAFAGYHTYRYYPLLERAKSLGWPFTAALSTGFRSLAATNRYARLSKYAVASLLPIDRYYFSCTSGPGDFFHVSRNNLFAPEFRKQVNGHSAERWLAAYFQRCRSTDTLDKMLFVDTMTWLPDDLLVKADKITMANSLELRVPFLDHKVLEFAASLPSEWKVKGLRLKHILKEVLKPRLPAPILARRKTGFAVPVERWLSGPLREYVYDVLTDRRTEQRGYFQPKTIRRLLHEEASGRRQSADLFCLLVLELWHRQFADLTDGIPHERASAVPQISL